MGGGTFSINGVPGGIEGVDVVGLLNKMIETASEKGGDVKSDIHEAMALTLAESAAIPYGQVCLLSKWSSWPMICSLLPCRGTHLMGE